MSVKTWVWLVVLLCIRLNGYAQLPFYHYFGDSILPGYRISGNFDSIDVKLGTYQSTLPMFWRPALDGFDPAKISFSANTSPNAKRYSSIPHVGLQYSFGTNLSQQAGISYTQALTGNQFIQLDYTRNSSNGAIRNSGFESNRFELSHLIRGKRYASQIELLFDGSLRETNGGLFNDSTDEAISLEFNDVEKSAATLTQRYFHADWKHFLSFTQDSLIKTGVYLAPRYQIENRRYQETGDIVAIYGIANIDPNQTNDYWERSEMGAVGGYFFHTERLAINAGFNTTYWDFDNLIRKSDTVETGLVSDLALDLLPVLKLRANGAYTLTGASGEKELAAVLSYKPAFADASVSFSFQQVYPKNYQRSYYANALNYSWQNKQLTTTARLNGTIHSKKRMLPLTATFAFTNVLNQPFFLNNSWRQDTLTNLSFLQISLRADLHWKKLFFQPFVRFQQSNFDYVPAVQTSARFGFDGFLFKAKKLRATIGADAGFTTSFSLLDYVPMMDTYVLPVNTTTARSYEAMFKLHVFTQFELGFFRWFIRVENIEQTFLKTTNQEALGYPVVPLQIRIGLSWDLFN